jgi:hypothetical protein
MLVVEPDADVVIDTTNRVNIENIKLIKIK